MAEELKINAERLVALATQRFGKLSDYEVEVLRVSAIGNCTVCVTPKIYPDSPDYPARADTSWGKEREVRAALIRWLCLAPEASKNIAPRGIQVRGASIRDELDLSGMTIPFALAILSSRLHNIDLRYARIESLNLGQCHIDSLNADGMDVNAMVFLNHGFTSAGEVRMVGGRIGGTLDCEGGVFKQTDDNTGLTAKCALHADRIDVRGNVGLRDEFVSVGSVRLLGARIGGTLECHDGTFGTLDFQGTAVKGGFFWQRVRTCNALVMAGMSAGSLSDDAGSWERTRNLVLDGFIYDRIIIDGPADVEMRLNWLSRQTNFAPQPYRQTAKVLRDMGYDDAGKQLLLEMERRLRAQDRSRLGLSGQHAVDYVWDSILDETVGYGIYPLRAIWYLGGLVALGWIVHRRALRVGAMAPTDREAYNAGDGLPSDYQPFSPFVYSLENCVPLVKLGQDERWQPDPTPGEPVVPISESRGLRIVNWVFDIIVPKKLLTPRVLRFFRYTMICLGWLLTTLLVAGLSGLIKSY